MQHPLDMDCKVCA